MNLEYNTDILKMMHNDNVIKHYKDIIVFEAQLNVGLKLYVYKENGYGFEFNDIFEYCIVKDILVMQSTDKIIIFDLSELTTLFSFEHYNFNIMDKAFINVYDNSLILLGKTLVHIYSINEKCVTDTVELNHRIGTKDYNSIGRIVTAYNFTGLTLLINTRNGKLIKAFDRQINNGYISTSARKNCFCDIIITKAESHIGSNEIVIGCICDNEYFSIEEYLVYIGIKDIKPVYGKSFGKDILGQHVIINPISHYDIVTEKGYIGTLSTDMRNLKIKRFGNGNLTSVNYEINRKTYNW